MLETTIAILILAIFIGILYGCVALVMFKMQDDHLRYDRRKRVRW